MQGHKRQKRNVERIRRDMRKEILTIESVPFATTIASMKHAKINEHKVLMQVCMGRRHLVNSQEIVLKDVQASVF